MNLQLTIAMIFALAAGAGAMQEPPPVPAPAAVVETGGASITNALTALAGAGGDTAALAAWLRDGRIEISFRDLDGQLSVSAGTEIWLDASLRAPAVLPRALAVLIAAQAARLRHAELPESAEKNYLAAAAAGRAFLVLGGVAGDLPDIGGVRAAGLSAQVRTWMTHKPEEAVRELNADGGPCLLEDLLALSDLRQYYIDMGGPVPQSVEKEYLAAEAVYERFLVLAEAAAFGSQKTETQIF